MMGLLWDCDGLWQLQSIVNGGWCWLMVVDGGWWWLEHEYLFFQKRFGMSFHPNGRTHILRCFDSSTLWFHQTWQWKIPYCMNGGFNRNITCKWSIFHCHVWWPEGGYWEFHNPNWLSYFSEGVEPPISMVNMTPIYRWCTYWKRWASMAMLNHQKVHRNI